tara:strand:+ start:36 stop:155 length:120 start_codon:yes stop_codon:yes gene_type:complete
VAEAIKIAVMLLQILVLAAVEAGDTRLAAEAAAEALEVI